MKKEVKGFNGLDPNATPDASDINLENAQELTELGEGALNKEKVVNRATEIETNINSELDKLGLTGEERVEGRKQILDALFQEHGMSYAAFDEMKQDLGLEPSQFFEHLGWLPIEQELSRQESTFKFADLIPLEMVKNGTKLVYYSDNLPADDLAGYKLPSDYVDKLYNSTGTIQTVERWHVYKDIHKGLRYPRIALNDFTSYESIFLALLSDVAFHIALPIARELYRLRLLMIQNPKSHTPNTDWTTITPDFSFESTDAYDFWTQVKDWIKGYDQYARSNMPTAWIPSGMTEPLEIKLPTSKYRLLVANDVYNTLTTQMKARVFNEKFLDANVEIIACDYGKAFGEYIGATNMGTTWENCDMRLIPVAEHKIICMYQGTTAQNLLTLHGVRHDFLRVGHSYNKNFPLLIARGKVKAPEQIIDKVA